jgi:glutathione S-transferase
MLAKPMLANPMSANPMSANPMLSRSATMITLYTFGPAFGLPDPSPFVTKAEILLKLAGLAFDTDTGGFGKAPKGKLPYLDDAGTLVADSTLIRCHIEKRYGFDFDKGLTAHARGVAWAVEKMLEDHVYWGAVEARWMDDRNFKAGPITFFQRVPALVRPLVVAMIRRQVRRNLHGQGLARHTPAEIATLMGRAIDALAAVLDDKPYLMGEDTCGADATAYAFTLGLLCPLFDTPMREQTASHTNLVAYAERMRARFHPDLPRLKAA